MHLSFIYKPQRDVTVLSSMKFTGYKAVDSLSLLVFSMSMYRNSSVMREFPSRLVLLVLIVHLMYISVSPVAFLNAVF